MASTTPNIGLTLPTGAEKVSRQIINDNNTKIDNAIGTLNGNISSLSEQMATLNTIVEKNITPATGATFNRTRIQKLGKICFFAMNGHSTSGSGWVTIATIPSDCTPADTYQSIVANDSTMEAVEMRVTSSGTMQLYNPPSGPVWGNIIWFC